MSVLQRVGYRGITVPTTVPRAGWAQVLQGSLVGRSGSAAQLIEHAYEVSLGGRAQVGLGSDRPDGV